MSLSLGIDTGGTYTDAVVFDTVAERVLAKAKALTTRHDLATSIAEAARRALDRAGADPARITLAAISTTLATNALVEGQGGRAGLVMIGFAETDLDRAGLRQALGDDPVLFVSGGHDGQGRPRPFDPSTLGPWLDRHAVTVSAVAVAGYFAVRNPDHELTVRDRVRAQTGLPVTCSHELSSRLDGPRRALTTLLNARLIGLIERLVSATRGFLADQAIDAPLMVVRGDGSLVAADFAALRPIETILSGPAASVVGARFLTGLDDAHVADIGGTTTDIALLDAGRPRIDPDGAEVGGYRTMVEAIAVRTVGLGGDSEVRHDEGALTPELHLGPRRVAPLSLLEALHPGAVIPHLRRQLEAVVPGRLDGRFALRTGADGVPDTVQRTAERDLLARLGSAPAPLDRLLRTTAELATLGRLVARGHALFGGLTPSDAQHVLGNFTHWNTEAARLGAGLMARRRDGAGRPLAGDAEALASRIVRRLERLSAEQIVESALAEDGLGEPHLARSALARRALDRSGRLVRTALILDRPVIGLGAAARTVYPAIGELLAAGTVVPDDAEVANAIGAVAGQVRVSVSAEIAAQADGDGFVLTGAGIGGTEIFAGEAAAMAAARDACRTAAAAKAAAAGAGAVEVSLREDVRAATVEGERRLVSATVTAIATGRPAMA